MFVNKIKVCIENCSYLKVYQTSGLYNPDNLEGWGDPNLERTYDGEAVLTINFNGDITDIDVKEIISESLLPKIDLIPDGFLISEDGIYTVTLTLTDSDTGEVYTAKTKITSECKVECCVVELAKKINPCKCDNSDFDNFTKANQMLESLKDISKNLGDAQYNSILKKLQKICKSGNCQC